MNDNVPNGFEIPPDDPETTVEIEIEIREDSADSWEIGGNHETNTEAEAPSEDDWDPRRQETRAREDDPPPDEE